jgi:hypothetical protein
MEQRLWNKVHLFRLGLGNVGNNSEIQVALLPI